MKELLLSLFTESLGSEKLGELSKVTQLVIDETGASVPFPLT